jgi:hypothetical protein
MRRQIGLSVADVVVFVSVGIIGGALVQYPLGLPVRPAGTGASCCSSTTCRRAWRRRWRWRWLGGTHPALANFVLVFVFGSFAMPLYSLSAAHANDRAGKGEFVLVNAALMLFYSVGAIGGTLRRLHR